MHSSNTASHNQVTDKNKQNNIECLKSEKKSRCEHAFLNFNCKSCEIICGLDFSESFHYEMFTLSKYAAGEWIINKGKV